MEHTRFGIILLENPFIRATDVERCLQIQSLGGWRKPIGQILLEEGVISQETLQLVLEIQERRRASTSVATPEPSCDEQLPELAELIQRGRRRNATDVLLALGRRPRGRIRGRIESLSTRRVDRCWMDDFLRAALEPREREALSEDRHVVTRLRQADGDSCRVTLFHDSYGISASIRLVPGQVPSLQELGHSESVVDLLDDKRGLVVVAGGPRSGKSTTIASMVEKLSCGNTGHVIVLDEHHEFSFSKSSNLITRKYVPRDADATAAALRAAFREDPDVIVVGELVGAEAIELSMQLASTGHLVIAGVQAADSIAALRKLEEGVPEQALRQFRGNLASELRGLVYQDLVPSQKRDELVLVEEVLQSTRQFRWTVSEGEYERIPILLSLDREADSVSLDDRLMDLVESGDVSIEEAFARARDTHRFLMTAG